MLSRVMISCAGTVSVTVRRLTRTRRSIDGISSCRPGPRCSISRPSRNTPPRSYSRSTRIELAAAVSSIRVLREYERGVVFRLGRLMEQRGPGLQLLIPSIDRLVRVSLRTVTLTVPAQEIITRDNIPARVTAVAYYRVIDPKKAVTEVENFDDATLQIAQTT